MKALFKYITNTVWWFVVLSVVFTAVSLVLFKQLAPYVGGYRAHIEKNITQIVGYPIQIGSINASLVGIEPKIILKDIALNVPVADNASVQPIKLESLTIQLDIAKSILNLDPIFSYMRFYRPEIKLVEKEGQWSVFGMSSTNSTSDDSGFFRALAYLLSQDHMSLLNLRAELIDMNGKESSLSSGAIYLQRTKKGFGLSGDVQHSDYDKVFEFSGEWLGDLSEPESLQFEAFVNIPTIKLPLEKILETDVFQQVDVETEAKVWLTYQPNETVNVSGHLFLSSPLFLENSYEIKSDFNFRYGLLDRTVDVGLVDLRVRENKTDYPAVNANFSTETFSQKRSVSLDFDQFDLALAHRLVSPLLNPDWFLSRMLGTMQPVGTAKNAHLKVWHEDSARFHYQSNLAIDSTSPFQVIPGVDNLNAILEVTDQGGGIEFVSDEATLAFPILLGERLETQGISGHVEWGNVQNAFVITGKNLQVNRNNAEIEGQFRFEAFEDKDNSDTLWLDFHGVNVPLADRLDYIPKDVLSDQGIEWIEKRVLAGNAKQVDFVLQTPLEEGATPHVLLALDIEKADVHFADDWPVAKEVEAVFNLDAKGIKVAVEEAKLQNIETKTLDIHLPFVSGKIASLEIDGQVNDEASDVFSLLRSTSLEESVLKPFESWVLAGGIRSDFHVSIPFSDDLVDPHISLVLDFDKNNLRIDNLNLPIRIHSGHLEYDSHTGVNNSSFQVSALDGDANVRLFGIQPVGQPVQITADLQGDADADAIVKWLRLPQGIEGVASGKVNFIGNIDINKYRAGQVDLSFTSNLRGVQLELPQPLGKFSDEREPLLVEIMNYDEEIIAEIDYKAHRARLGFDLSGFYGGELLVNDESAFSSDIKKGLFLKGQTNEYDNRPWFEFSNRVINNNQSDQFDFTIPKWLQKVDFIADKVTLNDKNDINNVKMTYDADKPNVGYKIVSDEMSLRLTENAHGPMMHFDYLSWNSTEDKGKDELEQPFRARQVPNMSVSVDQLYVDSTFYGDWQVVLTNEGDTLNVSSISSSLENGNFTGSLIWEDTSSPSVRFALDIEGEKIEEVTGKFTEQPFMFSEDYRIGLALNWNGSPFTFNNETLSGRLDMSAENGRITAIENMPPFLKTLGIFNLNALARRLTLDFSDINLPGLTFDDFSGKMIIRDGILTTVKPLVIDSPTINLSLEGSANLIEETLDEKLTASFPLGGTLPIAGMLLGATPQVAGLVFLTDKILGDPLSKVTSVQYSIKGSFSEPVIEPIEVKRPPRKRE